MDNIQRQRQNLMKVPGITARIANNLIEQGFFTLRVLRDTSDEELLAVQGIDQTKLQSIRDRCSGQ